MGWVRNEPGGTVVTGVLQGSNENVTEMLVAGSVLILVFRSIILCIFFSFSHRKNWLTNTGSPYSRIDKAEFFNERTISDFDFPDFSVRR